MHVMTSLVKLKIPFANMFLITLIVVTNETVKISNVSSAASFDPRYILF